MGNETKRMLEKRVNNASSAAAMGKREMALAQKNGTGVEESSVAERKTVVAEDAEHRSSATAPLEEVEDIDELKENAEQQLLLAGEHAVAAADARVVEEEGKSQLNRGKVLSQILHETKKVLEEKVDENQAEVIETLEAENDLKKRKNELKLDKKKETGIKNKLKVMEEKMAVAEEEMLELKNRVEKKQVVAKAKEKQVKKEV